MSSSASLIKTRSSEMNICYMYAIYSTGHQQSSEVYRSSRTIDQKSVMNCPDRKFIPKTQQFLFSLFWPFRLYKVLGKLARYYLLATIDMDQVISYHQHCFPVLVHQGRIMMMNEGDGKFRTLSQILKLCFCPPLQVSQEMVVTVSYCLVNCDTISAQILGFHH